MWRKGNHFTLLVGMQTSTATMENCGDFLLQYSWPWRIPMERSLVGDSPWGHGVRQDWATKYSTAPPWKLYSTYTIFDFTNWLNQHLPILPIQKNIKQYILIKVPLVFVTVFSNLYFDINSFSRSGYHKCPNFSKYQGHVFTSTL